MSYAMLKGVFQPNITNVSELTKAMESAVNGSVKLETASRSVQMCLAAIGIGAAAMSDAASQEKTVAFITGIISGREVTIEALSDAEMVALGQQFIAGGFTGGMMLHTIAESKVTFPGKGQFNGLAKGSTVTIGGIRFMVDMRSKSSFAGGASRLNEKVAAGIFIATALARFVIEEKGAVVNEGVTSKIRNMVRGGLAADDFSMKLAALEKGVLSHKDWKTKDGVTYKGAMGVIGVGDDDAVNPLIIIRGSYLRGGDDIAINSIKKAAVEALSRFLLDVEPSAKKKSLGSELFGGDIEKLKVMRSEILIAIAEATDVLENYNTGDALAKYAFQTAWAKAYGEKTGGAPAEKK